MGLLADIFSYGDGMKRKVNGLLQDPMGTASLGATRMAEDQNSLLALMDQAGYTPGSKSVLQTPQGQQQARNSLADKAMQTYGGLLGSVGKVAPPIDYRGGHKAPMKGSGAPLHDLTGGGTVYPDDVYSINGPRYYGSGDAADNEAFAIAMRLKNRPNAPVKMYRAVPAEPTTKDQINRLEKELALFMKRGIQPDGTKWSLGSPDWYGKASEELAQLKALPDVASPKLGINNGDWVTLTRKYAKDHGEGALGGKYKIVSKTVPARKLFTNGDSIQEFGYDESGRASLGLLGLLGGGTAAGLGAYQALKD